MNKQIFAAILSALLISACSHKSDDAASAAPKAIDAKTDLEKGAYYGPCVTEAYNYGVSQRNKIEFKDGNVSQTQQFFKNANCSGDAASTNPPTVQKYDVTAEAGQKAFIHLSTLDQSESGYMYSSSNPSGVWTIDRKSNKIVINEITGKDESQPVGEFTR